MRSRIVAILVALGCTLPGFAAPSQRRDLTFEERVEAQRAIEQVAWSHRIWPENNPGPKPPLSEVLPEAALRAKVEKYLRESNALDQLWHRPVSAADLQAELDRMVLGSRDPGRLQELFASLGNDPALIAETLGRQTLSNRVVRERYENDVRFHEAAPFDAWWESAGSGFGTTIEAPLAAYSVAAPATGGCVVNTWSSITADVVSRTGTSVWTGAEMIIWGGVNTGQQPPGYGGVGSRYDPATDTWSPTSTGGGNPDMRRYHTAVWTGTEMIVWGGQESKFPQDYLDSGGRYNPASDSWHATARNGATPPKRSFHVAVWSGTEMIVWGGYDGSAVYLSSGGRYSPSANSWTATNPAGTGPGRRDATAVWTGSEMITWGGLNQTNGSGQNIGNRYNPVSDSWQPTSLGNGVPAPRYDHTAVWTGSRMIVWGGVDSDELNTGGIYDPVTDTWTPTPIGPAARRSHLAVWTGIEMLIWGGIDYSSGGFISGSRFRPSSNAWTPMASTGAPGAGGAYVWTGSQMLVKGNNPDPGGAYCAESCSSPVTFYLDADGDGFGNGSVSQLACSTPSGWVATAGDCNDGSSAAHPGGTETCNGIDDDCDGTIDDGLLAPTASSMLILSAYDPYVFLDWTAVPNATSYDVIEGDLETLHSSGGNFAASTTGCVIDNTGNLSTSLLRPNAPGAFWHLVRAVSSCTGNGSYDDGTQQGSRDAEIAASGAACP